MSGVLNPFRSQIESDAWGAASLDNGDILFPGVVISLKCPARKLEWVAQNGIGLTGAALVFKGKKLIEGIEIVCSITTVEHWTQWERHHAYIQTPIGQKPKAHTVNHPALAELKRQVFTEYPESPDYVGKRGWVARYLLSEYRKQIPVPVGTADPAKIDGPPKPQDKLDEALLGILNKINKATGDP